MPEPFAPARSAPERKKPVSMSQRWTCTRCMTTGVVYCSSADDAAAVFELVYQGHKLKSPDCRNLVRFGRRQVADHRNEHKSAFEPLDDPGRPD
ncbi:MAG TPA: hypothetical protein VN240_07030 [Propylenella sp.]|nr:hypothetical protein [Propylenella sp.]